MAEKFPYEDIVNLPPHISKKHPQPSMMDRAARFAPFAAITGYEEMVLEEARVTEERVDLDEGALSLLNEKLNMIDLVGTGLSSVQACTEVIGRTRGEVHGIVA